MIEFSYNTNKKNLINRYLEKNTIIKSAVSEIINNVRTYGDKAVLDYTLKFDGAMLNNLIVSSQEVENAVRSISPKFLQILKDAAQNISDFHIKQKENGYEINKNGIVLGQKITALNSVGVYVPGGTASYPSSVLMNVIPAKIAGVPNIAIASPPDKKGNIPNNILVAAHIAGVNTIYKMGGAQAVAAFSYGTQSVKVVDKIVGPGNAYVTEAKRQVFGLVDIDMIAGPSEILIIADNTCNPEYIAADMLSQAEHDTMATSILLCNNENLAKAVQIEIEVQLKQLKRESIARQSINNNAKIIVYKDILEAIEIANIIAPEHLELCLDDPFKYLDLIINAGSIFLGKNVPEALGDYMAGPNHTLPTSGTARFSSPLGVYDFQKRSSYIYYNEEAFNSIANSVINFANEEGLQAHANSVKIRLGENK